MRKALKLIGLVLSVVMVVALFAACGGAPGTEDESEGASNAAPAAVAATAAPADEDALAGLKIGLICLHDKNSTYDKNFIDSMEEVQAKLGLSDDQVKIVDNVDESSECYETACDLVEEGCNLIFADSFGHEDYMLQAAIEFPDVQFCHATGTKAHTEGVANYHNAFAAIYEGRFLAGVAAGMKLNELIENGTIAEDGAKIGYVAAHPYAEVISGYTSFYLGAKSICPTATMDVVYTGTWYDESIEKEKANYLIQNGCVLISQHADSLGAPTACEEAGIPNVSYNGSTKQAGPTTYIISSRINWAPYYEYCINTVVNGGEIATDWTGTIATGSVELAELNEDVAAAGTQEKIDEIKALIEAGTLNVFDTSTFTVNGAALDTYLADVDSDADFVHETEAVKDGYFHESEYRSAPYFDAIIDGITVITEE
ncbi:MAG: BMP family ABC transporter substrate-binding protein [Clostridia bacterium]|nr:BMP family ABC transporter substrate-binding protein [Clostridia bacterium]